MSATQVNDPHIREAVEQLTAEIRTHYPSADFDVFHREDPDGVRLRVTVDEADTDAVLDTVIDQLYDYQVEQELPVYVVVVPPASRVAEQLATQPTRRASASVSPLISS